MQHGTLAASPGTLASSPCVQAVHAASVQAENQAPLQSLLRGWDFTSGRQFMGVSRYCLYPLERALNQRTLA